MAPTRRQVASRRRRRRLAAVVNDLSAEQWAAICAAWGGCAYCGAIGPVQKDCMLPVAHGGRYTVANVVPACPRCNASKGEAELTSWMRRRRLDESTFLMRRASLLAQLEAAFHVDGPGEVECAEDGAANRDGGREEPPARNRALPAHSAITVR